MKILSDLAEVKAYIKTTRISNESKIEMTKTIDNAMTIIDDQQDTVNALRNALARLLKDYDARVLRPEEALGDQDAVYYESKGGSSMWVDAFLDNSMKWAELRRFDATSLHMPLSSYGTKWRCWNKKPPFELMKETPWE